MSNQLNNEPRLFINELERTACACGCKEDKCEAVLMIYLMTLDPNFFLVFTGRKVV